MLCEVVVCVVALMCAVVVSVWLYLRGCVYVCGSIQGTEPSEEFVEAVAKQCFADTGCSTVTGT